MEVILSRDQRTTSHRVLDRTAQSYGLNDCNSASTLSPKCKIDVVAKSRYTEATITTTKRNNCAQRCLPCDSHLMPAFSDDRRIRLIRTAPVRVPTCPRLSWLWLSAVVILLASLVHSSPIMNDSSNHVIANEIRERMNTVAKWVHPCGVNFNDTEDADTQNLETAEINSNDLQHINSICILSENALTHALMFRSRYLAETFNEKNSSNIRTFTDKRYDWLPGWKEIPKEMGENLDKEYLDKLTLDQALISAYTYLQKYAVGLEQTSWDQELKRLGFSEEFKECEYKIRSLLCELQTTILDRGLKLPADVDRNIMPIKFRSEKTRNNATFRNMRDWLCYRDYINGLEYVKQVFEHLRERHQNSEN